MLAPNDKLKAGGNDIIQIVICTSCDETCSNCTQLLPFRKDYLHMSIPVFRKAVESLRDWPGVVALFGGNPCTHPKFPEICEILTEVIPEQKRRGLWTNNPLKHGAVARQTFYPHGRFNLNAHANRGAAKIIDLYLPDKRIPLTESKASIHSAILVDFHDMGISYEDWKAIREKCDINQKWSGAIVERDGLPFAYFCEVAAALDGIKGLNNGILATPEWWKHPMPAFAQQVQNCCDAGCGVPLRLRGHTDHESKYDVSPSMEPYTKDAKGKISVVTTHAGVNDVSEDAADYMKRWSK